MALQDYADIQVSFEAETVSRAGSRTFNGVGPEVTALFFLEVSSSSSLSLLEIVDDGEEFLLDVHQFVE